MAIDGAGADRAELAIHIGGDGEVTVGPGQPERQAIRSVDIVTL
jgi:hypothetical protein